MFTNISGVVLIRIPKTGSTSLRRMLGGDDTHGHMHAYDIVNTPKYVPAVIREFVAVIRHPNCRLVSALNSMWGSKSGWTLDRCLEAVLDDDFPGGNGRNMFTPQAKFLDAPTYPLTLFSMENINAAAKYLGAEGNVPHLNPSIARFTVEEVFAATAPHERLVRELMARYWLDKRLYTLAMISGASGWSNGVAS